MSTRWWCAEDVALSLWKGKLKITVKLTITISGVNSFLSFTVIQTWNNRCHKNHFLYFRLEILCSVQTKMDIKQHFKRYALYCRTNMPNKVSYPEWQYVEMHALWGKKKNSIVTVSMVTTLKGGGWGPGMKGTLPHCLITSPSGWKASSVVLFTSKPMVKYPWLNQSAISEFENGPVQG